MHHPNRLLARFASISLVWVWAWAALLAPGASAGGAPEPEPVKHRLYVAVPGIRDYLEYGGHGLLVYDIDNEHRLQKRIATAGLDANGKPLNVKGICASAHTKKLYISTTKQLMCIDLVSEKLLWERSYELGCDRMAITPDGATIFLPSLEGPLWYVVRAEDGEVLARITPHSGAHNTIAGLNGKEAYLAGLKSPFLAVAGTGSHEVIRTVGPFSSSIRPFTINGRQTLCFVNVNGLLGFEVGDLTSGRKRFRVEVRGYEVGPTKRHGCPSHGIGLTPDDKELWLTDAANSRMHIFDATVMPPKQVASIKLHDQPGWITFSIDGRYAYPSTGDVIDTRSRKIVSTLKDEAGGDVQSEKMVEVDFQGTEPVRAGDQFGLGRVGVGPKAGGSVGR
ncbi:MAG: YncE family protein [Isosphaerales bacterium]